MSQGKNYIDFLNSQKSLLKKYKNGLAKAGVVIADDGTPDASVTLNHAIKIHRFFDEETSIVSFHRTSAANQSTGSNIYAGLCCFLAFAGAIGGGIGAYYLTPTTVDTAEGPREQVGYRTINTAVSSVAILIGFCILAGCCIKRHNNLAAEAEELGEEEGAIQGFLKAHEPHKEQAKKEARKQKAQKKKPEEGEKKEPQHKVQHVQASQRLHTQNPRSVESSQSQDSQDSSDEEEKGGEDAEQFYTSPDAAQQSNDQANADSFVLTVHTPAKQGNEDKRAGDRQPSRWATPREQQNQGARVKAQRTQQQQQQSQV